MQEAISGVLREVRVPFMGSVENATILKWLVDEGGRVDEQTVLCEIETDKTVTEVGAPGAGVLVKRLVAEGTQLKVGALIGYLADSDVPEDTVHRELALLSGEASPSAPPPPTELPATDAAEVAAPTADSSSKPVRVSPLARRLAKEHAVDLARVVATGPSGRICGEDVLRAAREGAAAPAVTMREPALQLPGAEDANTLPTEASSLRGYEDVPFDRRANSGRRRTIARRLAETARTVPHLTADVQIDLSQLVAARNAYNARRQKAGQAAVSLLAFIARAACAALGQHPELNATYTDEALLVWKEVNLGVAVDTPEGLIVPVIRRAERLTVAELDAAIKDLAVRARDGALKPQDLEGGTFTLSNPGSLGPVLRAEAILNAPQVALLGLPGIQQVPIAVSRPDGTYGVEVRPVVRPSLTFDHRALDGGHVVRFLSDVKDRLETLVLDW